MLNANGWTIVKRKRKYHLFYDGKDTGARATNMGNLTLPHGISVPLVSDDNAVVIKLQG